MTQLADSQGEYAVVFAAAMMAKFDNFIRKLLNESHRSQSA
jgi:hypothetical protein